MARIDDLEKGLCDCNGEQVIAEIIDGKEHGDPVPKAPPVGMTRTLSMTEQIRQMIARDISMRAEEAGFDSFEDAQDFDIDDDPIDPHTPYEAVFDPPPVKEKEDGKSADATVDERRLAAAGSGSNVDDKVREGESDEEHATDDEGSVPPADSRTRSAPRKDRR